MHAHNSAAAAVAVDPLRALKLQCARQQLLRAQTARATAAAAAATAGSRRNADAHGNSDSESESINNGHVSSKSSSERQVAALKSQLKDVQAQRSAAYAAKAAVEVRCERAEADLAQVITLLYHTLNAALCKG
jgi:hypothetical protein